MITLPRLQVYLEKRSAWAVSVRNPGGGSVRCNKLGGLLLGCIDADFRKEIITVATFFENNKSTKFANFCILPRLKRISQHLTIF